MSEHEALSQDCRIGATMLRNRTPDMAGARALICPDLLACIIRILDDAGQALSPDKADKYAS